MIRSRALLKWEKMGTNEDRAGTVRSPCEVESSRAILIVQAMDAQEVDA